MIVGLIVGVGVVVGMIVAGRIDRLMAPRPRAADAPPAEPSTGTSQGPPRRSSRDRRRPAPPMSTPSPTTRRSPSSSEPSPTLEAGGQPLEATIALYERGVALQRRCERLLAEAELRVQQLVARAGGALAAVDVEPEDAEEA